MEGFCFNQTLASQTSPAAPAVTVTIVSGDSPFLWVPPPKFRGTIDIFSLCVSTTIICVWSSIHRDISTERLSRFRSFTQGIGLVILALLFPELPLFYALNQRRIAKMLVKEAQKHIPAVRVTNSFPNKRRVMREISNQHDSPQVSPAILYLTPAVLNYSLGNGKLK